MTFSVTCYACRCRFDVYLDGPPGCSAWCDAWPSTRACPSCGEELIGQGIYPDPSCGRCPMKLIMLADDSIVSERDLAEKGISP